MCPNAGFSGIQEKGAQARYKATDDDIKLVASAGNPTSTPQVLAFLANVSVNLMVYKLVDTTWTLYSVNPRGSRTIWVRLAEQHYRLLKPHPHKEPEISMLTAKAFKLPEGPTVLQGSGAPSSRGRESALMRDCRRSMGLGSDRTSGSAHVDSEMCAVLGFQKQADDTDLDIDNDIPMNQLSKAKPLQYLTCPCGDFEPTFEWDHSQKWGPATEKAYCKACTVANRHWRECQGCDPPMAALKRTIQPTQFAATRAIQARRVKAQNGLTECRKSMPPRIRNAACDPPGFKQPCIKCGWAHAGSAHGLKQMPCNRRTNKVTADEFRRATKGVGFAKRYLKRQSAWARKHPPSKANKVNKKRTMRIKYHEKRDAAMKKKRLANYRRQQTRASRQRG